MTPSKHDFKPVPDESDIAGIDRDLRFYPSDPNRDLNELSREQLESFNEQGFVRGVRIFDPGEIADIRSYFALFFCIYLSSSALALR